MKKAFITSAASFRDPVKIYLYSFDAAKGNSVLSPPQGSENGWSFTSPPLDGRGDYFFAFSHNEKFLAVLRNRYWHDTEIWLYNTKTWESKLLDTVSSLLFSVAWSIDDRKLVYKNDKNQIVSINVKHLTKEVLHEVSLPFFETALIGEEKNEFIIDVGTFSVHDVVRTSRQLTQTEMVIESSYRDNFPVVSPDGEKLLWVSNRTGINQIWYQGQNEGPKQVTFLSQDHEILSLAFSPDGHAFAGTLNGQLLVKKINNDGFENIDLLLNEKVISVSWKNNHQLVITKLVGRSREIIVYDISTRQESPLNIQDALFVKAIKDDVFLYTKFEAPGIWRYENGGSELFIETEHGIEDTYGWTVYSKGIYFVNKKQGRNKIFHYQFGNEKNNIEDTGLYSRFVSTSDSGSWIYHTQVEEGELNYYLIR